MQKGELLYEGKAKKVYRTGDPGIYLVEYKDDATAFNGLKKGVISGKGELNNKISAHFFRLLEEKGIATHFVEQVGEREMLVRALEIIPVEVVVRNIAAGSLARRLGMDEGTALPRPVVEYYYKSDELGDPMINDDHIAVLNLATGEEMSAMKKVALSVNEILRAYLTPRNLELVDFKLEFGRHEGKILLGDEISPDTCRFWDTRTKEKLDKDRFRRDLGGVEEAYQEVWRRLVG
ncbi:phosphoribosylaminoimidazolesuccinocarboxamide synthase [Desulfofundulus thermocisternus]|uniref:phosphoribosylaminoimidazolesuccinocarboxamide synthase n=1 Tax=Desulfofundulus thermocisternus TaxID=42471 RepID=UPI001A08DBBC|nr:phosphoribosylaminoimidazolesuccinocarboxamide synthase [Desulfofundulus thermocisternus]MBE3585702.1 phosphoribosylaminoimidazolesuccinocarboxamide synthase [Thermoanaerobacter sp.]MCS5696270.1 phosphoribosylaminoimidazolesuccinocarboxamide synthase [Desulfofundulus thermocisternus]